MNLPGDWPLLVAAGAAAAVAIVAGDFLPLSLPAGAAAVLLATLLFLQPAGGAVREPDPRPTSAPPTPTSSVRAAFRAGRAGRGSIVAELDRMERRVGDPDLPARSLEEEERIRRMGSGDFRDYVAGRLGALEHREGLR